ncbi:MAG: D-alanyl-D-alanine carboxypeptidase family protein [Wujia sp.]
MKKIICLVLISCMIVLSWNTDTVQAREEPPGESELYSLSAVLIDGDSGRVLYEKNGSDVRAMASTTKIMTLILALEYGNPDDLVTVSSYAAKMPDVQLGICEGEQYRLEDLIYSMMLESHNDSAVAIAEHIGGSVEGFAGMMNAKAKELGLTDTYFITPNGLDAENKDGKHSTTAVELAFIMRYCIMDSPVREQFIDICQTREHTFADYNGKRNFTVYNKNRFLDMMEGVIAGKTGFTADAGYCYVAALERDGRTYIIALLGCGWPGNKNYKWSDSRTLFEYGIDAFTYQTVLQKNMHTDDIAVIDGIGADHVSTEIRDDVSLLLADSDVAEIRVCMAEVLEAPVRAGDIVGTIDIYINDSLYSSVNVYAADSVRRIDFAYCLRRTFDMFVR